MSGRRSCRRVLGLGCLELGSWRGNCLALGAALGTGAALLPFRLIRQLRGRSSIIFFLFARSSIIFFALRQGQLGRLRLGFAAQGPASRPWRRLRLLHRFFLIENIFLKDLWGIRRFFRLPVPAGTASNLVMYVSAANNDYVGVRHLSRHALAGSLEHGAPGLLSVPPGGIAKLHFGAFGGSIPGLVQQIRGTRPCSLRRCTAVAAHVALAVSPSRALTAAWARALCWAQTKSGRAAGGRIRARLRREAHTRGRAPAAAALCKAIARRRLDAESQAAGPRALLERRRHVCGPPRQAGSLRRAR